MNDLISRQPETHEERTETHACDLISRQAAIDIERNATVDTNPSHFEAHQKFTQFMDDAEISSFGRWQWSNGFNTALTAVGIDLKKLPSAQPELTAGHWIQCKKDHPIKPGHYLCSFDRPNYIDEIYVGFAYWTGGRWYGYVEGAIKAWQPLPEPYQEGE